MGLNSITDIRKSSVQSYFLKNRYKYNLQGVDFMIKNHYSIISNLLFPKWSKIGGILYKGGEYRTKKEIEDNHLFFCHKDGLIIGYNRLWIYFKDQKKWKQFFWNSVGVENSYMVEDQVVLGGEKIKFPILGNLLKIIDELNKTFKHEESHQQEIKRSKDKSHDLILQNMDLNKLRNSEDILDVLLKKSGHELPIDWIKERVYDTLEYQYHRSKLVESDQKLNRIEVFEYFSENIYHTLKNKSKTQIEFYNEVIKLFDNLSTNVKQYYINNKYIESIESDFLNLLRNYKTFLESTKDKIDVLINYKFQNIPLLKNERTDMTFGGNYINGQYIKSYKGDHKYLVYNLKDIQYQIDDYFQILDYIENCFDILYFQINLIITILDKFKNTSVDNLNEYKIFKMDFEDSGIFMNNFQTKLLGGLNDIILELGNFQKNLIQHLQIQHNEIKKINLNIEQLTNIIGEGNQNISSLLLESNENLKDIGLLSLINTYQTYKINKNTKSLKS